LKPNPGLTLHIKDRLRWYWWVLLILLLSLACYALAVWIVGSMDYHNNNNDFFTFWLAGHMITRAGSPYDTAQWLAGYHLFDIRYIPNPAFLYPLPLALLLAPLGLLPFHSAYVFWVALTQLMIVACLVILLAMETNPRGKFFFIPLLIGIMLFRPTSLTLTQGQVSGLFLFALVWIAFLWHKGRWFWGGFLLGLLALKPNLGFIIILLVAIWLVLNKNWRTLCGTLIAGIITLVAGLIYNPAWVVQYLHVGSNKLAETFGGSPTIWGLGALISHNQITATLIFGSLTGLLILFGFFRVLLSAHATMLPVDVVALAVCVTLLVTPYTWTYDQLLLILPLTSAILAMDRIGIRFVLTTGVFLAIDVLAVILLIFDTLLQVEIWNVLVPLAVFGLCLVYLTRRIPSGNLEAVSKS
jgi:hypothetical protein